MTTNHYQEILLSELQKLEEEITSFPEEPLLWKIKGEIKNSAGNLCLHLCGNLQHYIGATLGKTGYVRNRDAEFSTKNIARKKLIEEIGHAKRAVENTLHSISFADLQKIYPQNFIGKEVNTEYFLIHLISHFDYHLGQINYLRRMMLKS